MSLGAAAQLDCVPVTADSATTACRAAQISIRISVFNVQPPYLLRSITTTRRLIDEVSELAVHVSSGMSGSIQADSPNMHSSPWALV